MDWLWWLLGAGALWLVFRKDGPTPSPGQDPLPGPAQPGKDAQATLANAALLDAFALKYNTACPHARIDDIYVERTASNEYYVTYKWSFKDGSGQDRSSILLSDFRRGVDPLCPAR